MGDREYEVMGGAGQQAVAGSGTIGRGALQRVLRISKGMATPLAA